MEKKLKKKKLNLKLLALLAILLLAAALEAFFILTNRPKEMIIIMPVNETKPQLTPTNESYRPTEIIENCTEDSDCEWLSTNCCPENAGAYWQCINRKSYIDCKSKLILCPQVISPKPSAACKCIGGICSAA